MKTRKVIYADKGTVLTDGKIYGTRIYLAEGQSANGFYEISAEQYEQMMADKVSEADTGGDEAE